jgi:hypothetical protein
MTIQKFIKYNPLNINGKISDSSHELKLNVLETSGNYLLHKDLLRHYTSQKQGTVSTKTRSEVRGVVENLGVKKELDVLEQVQIVPHYGKVGVLFLVQNQRKLF